MTYDDIAAIEELIDLRLAGLAEMVTAAVRDHFAAGAQQGVIGAYLDHLSARSFDQCVRVQ